MAKKPLRVFRASVVILPRKSLAIPTLHPVDLQTYDRKTPLLQDLVQPELVQEGGHRLEVAASALVLAPAMALSS